MIINLQQLHEIYLMCGKTDLQRGIDELANVVSQQYDLDLTRIGLCFVEHGKIVSKLYFGTMMFFCSYKRIENGRPSVTPQYK